MNCNEASPSNPAGMAAPKPPLPWTDRPLVLTTTTDDGVHVLTLNRPTQRNALDTALVEQVLQALRRADADPAVRAVVITGAGTVFSAGADLREFPSDRHDPLGVARRTRLFAELQTVFAEVGVPTLAAVNGHAVGAGASLAIAADLTLLSHDARLSYPEVRHRMVPSLMIPVLAARVGLKRAYELLATGAAIDAVTAQGLGLANSVVAPEALMPQALAQAKALGSMDREVLRRTKRLLLSLQGLPLEQAVAQALSSAAAQAGARPPRDPADSHETSRP